MAEFDVTAPDGRTFTVTAPDGAPQEAVLAYAQANYAKMPKEQSTLEKVSNVANAAAKLSPVGAIVAGGKAALEGIDKLAYKAGGAVTDATGSPELGTAVNVAGQAVPMAIGGVAGLLSKVPLRQAAESVMQSALVPSMKALKLGKGEQAIGTLLDEGVTLSKGGVEKLQGKIDVLSSAISDALKGSGATVDKGAVASRLQDVIGRIEKTSMNPQGRRAEVEAIYNEVLANQTLPKAIPVERAQQIKQGIYQMLKEKYGQLGSDSVEAQKALARGLKEEISSAVPGVAGLNAKESELINAIQLAEHRVLQSGNKNIGGLAWLTLSPERFAAFMADRSPMFKSIIARMINGASENSPALGVAGGAAYPQNKKP